MCSNSCAKLICVPSNHVYSNYELGSIYICLCIYSRVSVNQDRAQETARQLSLSMCSKFMSEAVSSAIIVLRRDRLAKFRTIALCINDPVSRLRKSEVCKGNSLWFGLNTLYILYIYTFYLNPTEFRSKENFFLT